ncbi:hypothetical protein [Entomobacter blattae]|uniref:Uncharacterized protein n=1 Tax=Entomobacter blattae TaxID=2762277 RepID=A0A7H1NQL0_9PROT|nr:hypothetical protein [Entomobacter blattae]QNT78070.1 hypothetical protein JGUZn3_08380 [Entomobacter blattae]
MSKRLFASFLAGIMLSSTAISPLFAAATPHHTSHKTKHSRHHKSHNTASSSTTPLMVPLTEQPGSELDKIARKLSADDLALAARHNENPLVLIGTAHISSRVDAKALFIQLQSAGMCGSAGCSTSVYLNKGGSWVNVLDSVSGPIAILPEEHDGMKDLLVDGTDKWIWHNGQYQDTITATPPPTRSNKRHPAKRKAHKAKSASKTSEEDTPPLKG